MAQKVSAAAFVAFLTQRCVKKDGYIMGATGQDPSKWATNSWWFTQYSGAQKTKALYWRDHAERVWDCNGLAEGYYKDITGVDINARARNNYAEWCDPKGTGTIPNQHKVPGAAVFIYSTSEGAITHVGYLEKPVDAAKPTDDWYVIEAQGVMYGVVRTKLNSRGWNRWGLMTKYFDYDSASIAPTSEQPATDTGKQNPYTEPTVNLKKGSKGTGVKWVQWALTNAGYSVGKYGVDGDFGNDTGVAVRKYQAAQKLTVDGVVGPKTRAALKAVTGNSTTNTAPPAANGHIIDISEYQGDIDWDKLAPEVSLVILRCGLTKNATMQPGTDARFKQYAGECVKRSIPFGVYYFGRAGTVNLANQEAEAAYTYASVFNPLFYVYDAEDERITKATAKVFIDRIKLLGAKKTGYYISHNLYNTYKLDITAVDFIWIPRYGTNDGKYDKAPDYPCDLHQYTSAGKVAGISGNGDINRLTGSKPLSWFISK